MITGDYVAAFTAADGMSPVLVPGLQKWRGQGKVIRLNGQTAEDLGYTHPAAGSKSVEVSMSLVIDITAGSLVALEPGTIISGLGLYADADANDPIYLIPHFLILDCVPGGEMNGQFMCEVSGENIGPYQFNDPN